MTAIAVANQSDALPTPGIRIESKYFRFDGDNVMKLVSSRSATFISTELQD